MKNSELARQFRLISRESEGLFRGPILEATPNYRKGKSLMELITEKGAYISEAFGDYAPGLGRQEVQRRLPLDRRLYTHQEKALEKDRREKPQRRHSHRYGFRENRMFFCSPLSIVF